MDKNTADFLEHFGVKGMKWGVRKEDSLVGEKNKSVTKTEVGANKSSVVTSDEIEILKKFDLGPTEGARLEGMFGSPMTKKGGQSKPEKDNPSTKKGLSETQKKILIGAGIGIAVIGVNVALAKYADNAALNPNGVLNGSSENFKSFWKIYNKTAAKASQNLSLQDLEKLSSTPLNFGAGSIFKRVSFNVEDYVRPNGFFASFKDEDIERYKATLPIFWKLWGLNNGSPSIVSLKANADIKAPSPRETFNIWQSMLEANSLVPWDDSIPLDMRGTVYTQQTLRQALRQDSNQTALNVALKTFKKMTTDWAQAKGSGEDEPISKMFFEEVKRRGYNALVDSNDSGSLSDTPMRFLDGTLFSISENQPLTEEAIKMAQEKIKSVIHSLFDNQLSKEFMVRDDLADFLSHYGVKGMKWGVNRSKGESGGLRRAAKRGLIAVDKKAASYLKKKSDLQAEAFVWDLFGIKSSARIKLDTMDFLEKSSIELGKIAARAIIDKSIDLKYASKRKETETSPRDAYNRRYSGLN